MPKKKQRNPCNQTGSITTRASVAGCRRSVRYLDTIHDESLALVMSLLQAAGFLNGKQAVRVLDPGQRQDPALAGSAALGGLVAQGAGLWGRGLVTHGSCLILDTCRRGKTVRPSRRSTAAAKVGWHATASQICSRGAPTSADSFAAVQVESFRSQQVGAICDL
jgi:hypothetical protein